MAARTRQYILSFRFDDEEFKVILEDSNSSKLFFNYLKDMHLISREYDFETWLNLIINNNSIIQCFTNKISLKIRKKAKSLGLSIILEKTSAQEQEDGDGRSRKETFNI